MIRLSEQQEEGLQDLLKYWPTWSDEMRANVLRAILWNNTLWGVKLGAAVGLLAGAAPVAEAIVRANFQHEQQYEAAVA